MASAFKVLMPTMTGFFWNQSQWNQISGPADSFDIASNYFLLQSLTVNISVTVTYGSDPPIIYSTGPTLLNTNDPSITNWGNDPKNRLLFPQGILGNPFSYTSAPIAFAGLPIPDGLLALYLSLATDGYGNYKVLPGLFLNAPTILGFRIYALRFPALNTPDGPPATFANTFTQFGTISWWGQNIPIYNDIQIFGYDPVPVINSWSVIIDDSAPNSYFQPSDFN